MIHGDQVALADLLAADQVADPGHDLLLDEPLQGAGAVLDVGAGLDQPGLGPRGDLEQEGLAAAQAAVVNLGQQDVEDLVEVSVLERLEGDDVVEAVQELEGEDLPGLPHGRVLDVAVQALPAGAGVEADGVLRQVLAHGRAADVGGQDDDRLPEVHFLVVAEDHGAVLQDAEQEVPELGVRLLDLVEEHDAEAAVALGRVELRQLAAGLGDQAGLALQRLAVMPVDVLLGQQRTDLPADVAGRRSQQLADVVVGGVLLAVDAGERRSRSCLRRSAP